MKRAAAAAKKTRAKTPTRKALDKQALYELAREDLAVFAALTCRTDRGAPLEAAAGSWHEELVDLLMALERGRVSAAAARALRGTAVAGAPFTAFNNNCPPGIGKSKWCSVVFPAWYLGRHPERRVGIVSSESKLAIDFSLAVRALMQTAAYRAIFPGVKPVARGRASRSFKESAWSIEGRAADETSPSFWAVGVYGTQIGKRADLLIFDDVCDLESASSRRQREKLSQYLRQNIMTRLVEGGRMMNIGARQAPHDWHGELESEGVPTIRRAALTAADGGGGTVEEMLGRGAELVPICPTIFSLEGELARRMKLRYAIYEINCQQNVEFALKTEGKHLRRDMLRYDAAAAPRGAMIGIAVDCAMSEADDRDNAEVDKLAFTAIVEGWRAAGGDGTLHVTGLDRERIGFLAQVKRVAARIRAARAAGHEVLVGIENRAGGKQLIAILAKELCRGHGAAALDEMELDEMLEELEDRGITFMEFDPIVRKTERAAELITLAQRGRLRLAAAFEEHEDELVQFPDAAQNDIVDAAAWLSRLKLEHADEAAAADDDEDDDEDEDEDALAAAAVASRRKRRESDVLGRHKKRAADDDEADALLTGLDRMCA